MTAVVCRSGFKKLNDNIVFIHVWLKL